ncbi:cysteine hydrolase family protein [Fictibacillus iocasae]|uniref:Cysteine hydrolase family protein n=1 Tax=Fictibacillus iocasae TaxID=2715437 RepID=A0ABW2NV71_9BACL
MKKALLIIDVQQGFENERWGERNNPDAENNMLRLIEQFRESGLEVIHIQHASKTEDGSFFPEKEGYRFKKGFEPRPEEAHFVKNVNSAFIGTKLKEHLEKNKLTHLTVAGLTTCHCVSTTVRMAANYGFTVDLVHDATAAFEMASYDGRKYSAQEVHDTALLHLNEEFAGIVTTEDVIRGLTAQTAQK